VHKFTNSKNEEIEDGWQFCQNHLPFCKASDPEMIKLPNDEKE